MIFDSNFLPATNFYFCVIADLQSKNYEKTLLEQLSRPLEIV